MDNQNKNLEYNFGYLWSHAATKGKVYSKDVLNLIENAHNDGIKIGESKIIHFGRWLLKHAKPVWDSNVLCWSYQGENKDTEELFKIFMSHNGLF